MNLIKRHKGLAVICFLTLILLIVLFAIFSRMIFSTGKTEYGDRLKNIVEIKKNVLDDVKSSTEEYEEVEEVTIRIQGKIVYTIIKVTEATSKDRAKEIAAKTLEKYSKEVIDCYDFEFIINQKEQLDEEGNDKSYTIAGTKHPSKENISWTRN